MKLKNVYGIAWWFDEKGVPEVAFQNYDNEVILTLSVKGAWKLRKKLKGNTFPKEIGKLEGLRFENAQHLKECIDAVLLQIDHAMIEQKKLAKIIDGNLSEKQTQKKLRKINREKQPGKLEVIGDKKDGTLMAVWA